MIDIGIYPAGTESDALYNMHLEAACLLETLSAEQYDKVSRLMKIFAPFTFWQLMMYHPDQGHPESPGLRVRREAEESAKQAARRASMDAGRTEGRGRRQRVSGDSFGDYSDS